MNNGIFVREGYLESAKVASLADNPLAERFYFHLILAASADGTIDNDLTLIRNRCFPAIESIRTFAVSVWLSDCIRAGLLRPFVHPKTGKSMIEVLKHEPPGKPKADSGIIPDDSDSCYPFAAFWDDYGKKIDVQKCHRRYSHLSEAERAQIKEKLPEYVRSTPDMQFRKNPATWINNRSWEDEDLPFHNAWHHDAASPVTPVMRRRKGL